MLNIFCAIYTYKSNYIPAYYCLRHHGNRSLEDFLYPIQTVTSESQYQTHISHMQACQASHYLFHLHLQTSRCNLNSPLSITRRSLVSSSAASLSICSCSCSSASSSLFTYWLVSRRFWTKEVSAYKPDHARLRKWTGPLGDGIMCNSTLASFSYAHTKIQSSFIMNGNLDIVTISWYCKIPRKNLFFFWGGGGGPSKSPSFRINWTPSLSLITHPELSQTKLSSHTLKPWSCHGITRSETL